MLSALSEQLAAEQQQMQQQGHSQEEVGPSNVTAALGMVMGPAMRGEPGFNIPGPW